MSGFALFDTPIGTCGVVWTDGGIARVRFPGASRAATAAALARRHPGAQESGPPLPVLAATDRMRRLLEGKPIDLSDITIDLGDAPAFSRRVYDVARTIAPGHTLTYGEVAARLGDKRQAQAVGKALGENPIPLIIPCHRVLAAGGRTGGFSAPGGIATKMRILSIERARVGAPGLFDDLPLSAKPA